MRYTLILLYATMCMLSGCAADHPIGLCVELGTCSAKSCAEQAEDGEESSECKAESEDASHGVMSTEPAAPDSSN